MRNDIPTFVIVSATKFALAHALGVKMDDPQVQGFVPVAKDAIASGCGDLTRVAVTYVQKVLPHETAGDVECHVRDAIAAEWRGIQKRNAGV